MNILVLMGGDSTEREISLRTGAGIVAALEARGHRVLAGDPATGRFARGEVLGRAAQGAIAGGNTGGAGSAGGAGNMGGTAGSSESDHPGGAKSSLVLAEHTQALLTAREAAAVDVIFIALHGGAGEDGKLQTLLELAGRPYTGSGPLASALAMDKVMAKRMFEWAGILTPDGVELHAPAAQALAREAVPSPGGAWAAPESLRHLGLPLVVKPVDQGSTIGLTIIQGWGELRAALEEALRFGERVLCERYIPGRELAIGILGDQALPIVEIEPTKELYDYECKYTKGMSRYTCPAKLDPAVAKTAQTAALKAFQVLSCADFGRVDVRLAPDGRPYVLEVNTIPGMTETSLLPMAAAAAGMSYEALVERMCELALARRSKPAAASSVR